MITTLLLVIIYLAFISLGLPDAILGVAWPSMRLDLGMDLDAAGLIALVTTIGTIASSLLSGHIIQRFGTGKVTFLSGAMTSIALLGIAFSPSYLWVVLLAVPLGFGAGSVDTALNNYVALHFKAHHMNWLHSFWGVGATLGPVIMGQAFLREGSWRTGYLSIGSIQMLLAAVLLLSLPLWKRHHAHVLSNSAGTDTVTKEEHTSEGSSSELKSQGNGSKEQSHFFNRIRIKGVPFALLTFLFYCAAEISVGLWGSSYLVTIKSLSVKAAASWIALYYSGITVGRVLSGFISFKVTNNQMIHGGALLSILGALALLLPLPNGILKLAFVFIGMGFAPIFPSMIHETPVRFGKENSQFIIGYQMASAYIGIGFLPPLMGIVAHQTSMTIFPPFLLICILLMAFSAHRVMALHANN